MNGGTPPPPIPLRRAAFLDSFTCLGDKCEDTCCKGWGMQLDPVRYSLYQKEAPELLDAVTTGEAERIMRRDPVTDQCVKLDGGWCGIHKTRGSEFLGDACHFYPRITRGLGSDTYMTAALSCPEVVRLTLYAAGEPFSWSDREVTRVPVEMKDYKPETMTQEQAKSVMDAFIQAAGDATATPERIMIRLVNATQSLTTIAEKDWHQAAGFLLRIADGKLLPAETNDADYYRLVNILVGLIAAAKKTSRPRLDEVVEAMERALQIRIDRVNLTITSNSHSLEAHRTLETRYRAGTDSALAPILRRWIQAELSMAAFPFAGFGSDMKERIMFIAIRFATLRLALMAQIREDGTAPDEGTVVKTVQSLARFLDHLADPTFSRMAYEEAGWLREGRLRALVGDSPLSLS